MNILNSLKTKNYKLKPSRGFSLLELLIYITILSIVGLTVGGIFISINQGRLKSETRAEINSSLRFALEKIKQDVREATDITSPNGGVDGASLVITVDSNTITYDVSGGQLRRDIAGTPAFITPSDINITAISFKRFHSINPQTSKVLASVRTQITAGYSGTAPDLQFTEEMRAIAPMGEVFNHSGALGMQPQ